MTEYNYSTFNAKHERGLFAAELAETLLPLLQSPDSYIDRGKMLKDSVSTKVALVELADKKTVFIKRYNNKSLRYTLRYLFRATRPFRVFNAVQRLKQLNIPTPDILAVLSQRDIWHIPHGSYVIHEYWDHCLTTAEYCHLLYQQPELKQQFCRNITGYLAAMHRNGMRHNDIKLSNICCRQHDTTFTFGLWDLDGIMMFKQPYISKKFIHRDLARLISSWLIQGEAMQCNLNRETETEQFITAYREQNDFSCNRQQLDSAIDNFISRKRRKERR